MSRTRLTSGGLALIAGLALVAAVGVFTGYREYLVLVAAGLALLVSAFVFPRTASPVAIDRRLSRVLIQRGDPLDVRLDVSATDRTRPVRIVDRVGDKTATLAIPALEANQVYSTHYQIATTQRGIHPVGPALEERRDPFDLAVRSIQHDARREIFVHPLIHNLGRLDSGALVRQQATPFSTITLDPLADFRSLREYQAGDDTRLIHWPTYARLGTLIVRDFLDLRRSARFVLLETIEGVLTADEFEEAIEIAASLALQSLETGLVTFISTTDPESAGGRKPFVNKESILELFTTVKRTAAKASVPIGKLVPTELSPDQVIVVTGSRSSLLPSLVGRPNLRSKLSIIRVTSSTTPLPRLPLPTIDVRSGIEFALRWRKGALI